MNEEQAKRFRDACIRFAHWRKNFQDADDFAQEAYCMVMRWSGMSMKQAWAMYWRTKLGVKGYPKHRILQAIYFRQVDVQFGTNNLDRHKASVLEEMVPSPESEKRMSLPYLSLEEACLRILLEEGFTCDEICIQMNRPKSSILELNTQLKLTIFKHEPDLVESMITHNDLAQRTDVRLSEKLEEQKMRQKSREITPVVSLSDLSQILEGRV